MKLRNSVRVIVLSLSVFVLPSQLLFAQKSNDDISAAFEKGSKTIGLAMGVGTNYDFFYYSGYTQYPLFGIIYDQGIIGNVGPGTIGVGGIIAVKTAIDDYANGFKARSNNFIIGVRGTYHLTLLKSKNNKFDPYGGVTFGLRIYKYNDPFYNDFDNGIYPVAGLFVGAKYNFSKNFGAFSELGYDISFFRIGICVNF